MPTVKYSISSKVYNGQAEVLVRFYAGTTFSQRAKSHIQVTAAAWNASAGALTIPRKVTPEVLELNQQQRKLDALRDAIFAVWYNEQYTAGDGWLQSTIDDYFAIPKECLRVRMSQLVMDCAADKKITGRSLDQYEVIARIFEGYDKHYKPLYTDNFTPEAVAKLMEYYRTMPRILKSGEIKQVERGNNTLRSKERLISAICTWAVHKKLMPSSPFGAEADGLYAIGSEVYGDIVYLTREERDAIYAYQFPSQLLNIVRDIFIFQCHVGCRVSDLLTFTADNITRDGFLQYIPIKTRKDTHNVVRVPLSDIAKEILERYSGQQPDGRILPFLNESDYNARIHDMARIAGLKRKVIILNSRTNEQETKELWQVTTSHVARKTFSMAIFRTTRSEMVSASFTGHSNNTRSFKRYAKVDDEMKKQILNELQS